jgi:protein-S-isoprenylcysteine O-methyltransferase Ste14
MIHKEVKFDNEYFRDNIAKARQVKETPEFKVRYFHPISYALSRFAVAATLFDFIIFLTFILNDPFNLGSIAPFQIPTLDFDEYHLKSRVTCSPVIRSHLMSNLFYFALWWGTHSGLARKVTKNALGLLGHPIEKPLFASIAAITWFIQMYTWQPISDCSRWDTRDTSIGSWIISGCIIALSCLLIAGTLWTHPDNMFGTEKYKYQQGKFPKQKLIKSTFPFGLVRHPISTGMLWCIWALPSYTPSHILLASLWTAFIVISNLEFEERKFSQKTEVGREYAQYRKEVWAFLPTLKSALTVLGLRKYLEKEEVAATPTITWVGRALTVLSFIPKSVLSNLGSGFRTLGDNQTVKRLLIWLGLEKKESDSAITRFLTALAATATVKSVLDTFGIHPAESEKQASEKPKKDESAAADDKVKED